MTPAFSVLCLTSVFLSVGQIKQAQDEERKQLTQLRDVLKTALQVEQKEVRRITSSQATTTNLNAFYSDFMSS